MLVAFRNENQPHCVLISKFVVFDSQLKIINERLKKIQCIVKLNPHLMLYHLLLFE